MVVQDEMRDRLIVGLDVPTVADAEQVVAGLGDAVRFYKIGYQLAYAGGFDFARELIADGRKVFLDLKLLDIDNTVARGVESVARLGAAMLTIHAYPKAMRVAVEAARGSGLCLLGVTVLTSMDDADLGEAGYAEGAAALAARRAGQARDAGMGGIVCAAPEAATLRRVIGPDMALVTPGIRPAGSDAGDQKRIATPADALRAGASHLVVARPVVAASDRGLAARAILDEMAAA